MRKAIANWWKRFRCKHPAYRYRFENYELEAMREGVSVPMMRCDRICPRCEKVFSSVAGVDFGELERRQVDYWHGVFTRSQKALAQVTLSIEGQAVS